MKRLHGMTAQRLGIAAVWVIEFRHAETDADFCFVAEDNYKCS